jgi:hypothetical protein
MTVSHRRKVRIEAWPFNLFSRPDEVREGPSGLGRLAAERPGLPRWIGRAGHAHGAEPGAVRMQGRHIANWAVDMASSLSLCGSAVCSTCWTCCPGCGTSRRGTGYRAQYLTDAPAVPCLRGCSDLQAELCPAAAVPFMIGEHPAALFSFVFFSSSLPSHLPLPLSLWLSKGCSTVLGKDKSTASDIGSSHLLESCRSWIPGFCDLRDSRCGWLCGGEGKRNWRRPEVENHTFRQGC